MKIVFSILICLLLYSAAATAQQRNAYIIQLRDKSGGGYSLSNPAAYLSPRAIERRLRQNIPVDSSDLPVSRAYLDSILAAGNLDIHVVLKWQNEVCIHTADLAALEKIRQFPFVKRIVSIDRQQSIPLELLGRETIPTATLLKNSKKLSGEWAKGRSPTVLPSQKTPDSAYPSTRLSYGNSFEQIHIHRGEYLHDQGFLGQGMLIAVLDAGFFHYKTNPAFDSLRLQHRVVAEWDFVKNEASVNEDHSHGMICLSLMASHLPGILMGSAPAAAYLLLRTEDTGMEMPIEEYNWAAAAEYADSAGADMISSSLGYVNFDDPAYNHSYSQRDGRTTIITRAANKAAGKGMLVMSSAGNDGAKPDDLKFVACPADGDSVLAVGAVNSQGVIANFSDWGPNAAGKIKPDVVSVGENTFYTLSTGVPAQASGTSLANPNLAGLVACLWQAFPEFTNMEIMEAVRQSAHKHSSPDERYGYGIPDVKIASDLLDRQRSDRAAQSILGNTRIKVFPVPFTSYIDLLIGPGVAGRATVQLVDMAGRLIQTQKINPSPDGHTYFRFTRLNRLSRGVYLVYFRSRQYNACFKLTK